MQRLKVLGLLSHTDMDYHGGCYKYVSFGLFVLSISKGARRVPNIRQKVTTLTL